MCGHSVINAKHFRFRMIHTLYEHHKTLAILNIFGTPNQWYKCVTLCFSFSWQDSMSKFLTLFSASAHDLIKRQSRVLSSTAELAASSCEAHWSFATRFSSKPRHHSALAWDWSRCSETTAANDDLSTGDWVFWIQALSAFFGKVCISDVCWGGEDPAYYVDTNNCVVDQLDPAVVIFFHACVPFWSSSEHCTQ